MMPGMHMSEARKWIGDVKEQMSSLSSASSSHMHR